MPVREHVHVYFLIDKMLISIKNYDLDEVGALEKKMNTTVTINTFAFYQLIFHILHKDL